MKYSGDSRDTFRIDLAPLSNEKRATLEKLRRAIKSAAPKAEECISYQIPAFRLAGRMLVAFGAAANHCVFYPGAFPLEVHKDELKAYDTSKGTIRFQLASPLPATLMRKLVKTRIAEYAAPQSVAVVGKAFWLTLVALASMLPETAPATLAHRRRDVASKEGESNWTQ